VNRRTLVIIGSGILLTVGSLAASTTNFAKTTPSRPLIVDRSTVANRGIPAKYQPILTSPGVRVFKNSERESYITIVDLNRAEAIDLIGKYTDAPNGKIAPRSMTQFWQDSVSQNTSKRQAKVVINGAFFAKYNQPTPIAFGLKTAGTVISYGYGLDEFPGLNKTVAWSNTTKEARIDDYDRATFDNPRFPEVVGALAETAGKRANRELGRTFIGVQDGDGNGKNETIIVFSSKAAKQIDAVTALKSFGASRVAMLDGGGSTGLVIDGKRAIDSGTSVPHAIGFYTY
jgi:hypothetical protein